MKKMICITLIICCFISLIACRSSVDVTYEPSQNSHEISPKETQDNPLLDAESAYNDAVANFNVAQTELFGNIERANATLESVTESDVADPGLLSELRDISQNAALAADASLPTMESEPEMIWDQVQTIIEQTDTFWNFISEIDDTILAIQNSQQELIDIQRREAVSAKQAYVGTSTTVNGYKAEFTIALTHWIKASDAESLQLAWEVVGGTGSVPSISQFQTLPNDGFTEANAAIAFGNISFKNTTEGFDFSESNPVTFQVNFRIDTDVIYKTFSSPKLYVKYSNSTRIFKFTSEYPNISPEMKSNTWGPVPFMIICPNAFTPDYPDGISILDNFKIYFNYGGYGDYFTITT